MQGDSVIKEAITQIKSRLPEQTKLVAVSKFHPSSAIREAYEGGQRSFGENRPQEFEKKVLELGFGGKGELNEIEWHFIGHLQTNKLKMVLPYADCVESVDTIHLLDEINEWAKANSKTVNVLLEMHIAGEDTKQGFYEEDILELLFKVSEDGECRGKYSNVRFCGLMGMASHTEDEDIIRADFERISSFKDYLNDLFPELVSFKELSIGMSGDWPIALECGSTIVRIGTAIFGERQHP